MKIDWRDVIKMIIVYVVFAVGCFGLARAVGCSLVGGVAVGGVAPIGIGWMLEKVVRWMEEREEEVRRGRGRERRCRD